MRRILLILPILAALLFAPMSASATSAKGLPETTCQLTAHVPWATQDLTGNWYIKTKSTVTCNQTVDQIEVVANLTKQKVEAGSHSVFLRQAKTTCNKAQTCKAIIEYDVKDTPDFVWIWWTTGTGYVTDADGDDFDSDQSNSLVWPWEP